MLVDWPLGRKGGCYLVSELMSVPSFRRGTWRGSVTQSDFDLGEPVKGFSVQIVASQAA